MRGGRRPDKPGERRQLDLTREMPGFNASEAAQRTHVKRVIPALEAKIAAGDALAHAEERTLRLCKPETLSSKARAVRGQLWRSRLSEIQKAVAERKPLSKAQQDVLLTAEERLLSPGLLDRRDMLKRERETGVREH